tara:strand:+ start:7999 stop:8874 length:876 start_codon:yes stop_codon:yes gene_type:complete
MSEVKQYIVKRKISEKKADKLKGVFLNDKHYDLLIREDADGYDTRGNLLFRYRKKAVDYDLLKSGYEAFEKSITHTEGRGIASGSSHKRIRKDGTIANTTVGNFVYSGNVGYMDPSAMVRYCRQTAFARDHFEEFKSGIPFVKAIDKLYEKYCPVYYAKQRKIADATDINYRIKDTSFTTITVNKNFRTACHQDAGDYREGFGNLIVYREGDWTGGYFVLPEFGVAVEMGNEDVLFADVHKWHGNTEIMNQHEGWLRISFVMYYRENMYKCDTPSEELKKTKMKTGGYLKL